MNLIIRRNGTKSFAVNYFGDIGINIAPGHDIIDIFQWLNRNYLDIIKAPHNVSMAFYTKKNRE